MTRNVHVHVEVRHGPLFHGSLVPYSSLGIALILVLERVVVSVAILVRVHDIYPQLLLRYFLACAGDGGVAMRSKRRSRGSLRDRR